MCAKGLRYNPQPVAMLHATCYTEVYPNIACYFIACMCCRATPMKKRESVSGRRVLDHGQAMITAMARMQNGVAC